MRADYRKDNRKLQEAFESMNAKVKNWWAESRMKFTGKFSKTTWFWKTRSLKWKCSCSRFTKKWRSSRYREDTRSTLLRISDTSEIILGQTKSVEIRDPEDKVGLSSLDNVRMTEAEGRRISDTSETILNKRAVSELKALKKKMELFRRIESTDS